MSEKTLADIQDAVQAHLDSFSEDGPEQVAEMVVMYASLDSHGGWSYNYCTGNMSTPHASLGLVQIVGAMLSDDVIPVTADEDDAK